MMKWLREFWKSLKQNILIARRRKLAPVSPKEPIPLAKPPEAEKKVYIQPAKDFVHIQVGLDFGTNCTKVCYSIIGGTHKIVPFRYKHNLSTYPDYTIPSVVAFGSDGKILFGGKAAALIESERWEFGIRNLKTILASRGDNAFLDEMSEQLFNENIVRGKLNPKVYTPDIFTAMYIAYLMHNIREVITKKFNSSKINLNFNICIPVDYIQNNVVREKFEKAFALAEMIEKRWQTVREGFDMRETALKLYERACYDENNPETRIFAIPEAVAEMVAYLKSFRKREGVHALIDFGAGTTDVSIFRLSRLIEDRSDWYAAKAIPYGSFQIEKILVNCLKRIKGEYLKFKDVYDALTSINKFPRKFIELSNIVKEELNKFLSSKDYRRTWSEAYLHLKEESLWHDVKIFVSGGGSQLPHIKELISYPWHPHIAREKNYEVEVLSKPDDFDAPSNIPFHRMAVAYGLTWSKPLLKGYTLPNDAPDHTPPPLPRRGILDREELYPK